VPPAAPEPEPSLEDIIARATAFDEPEPEAAEAVIADLGGDPLDEAELEEATLEEAEPLLEEAEPLLDEAEPLWHDPADDEPNRN
jgi:hypothetical protein